MPQPQTVFDFHAIRLRLASPEVILSWSHGEVTRPETINYRTQKPEKSGLFAEEIFGPTKDWECYCGKYRKIRYKGIVCDKCGVEVTHSLVRRERMGHIALAAPVAHIWFLRSVPSKIALVLNSTSQAVEKVAYFANFVITEVDVQKKNELLESLRQEYKSKRKQIETDFERGRAVTKEGDAAAVRTLEETREHKLRALEEDFQDTDRDIRMLDPLRLLTELQYQELSLKYGHLFDAGSGAEALLALLKKINIETAIKHIEAEVDEVPEAKRVRLVRRAKLLHSLKRQNIHPSWMILNVLPVIPPDLRPMVALDGGRFATSDLNDLYRRVINRNNRLKRLLELNAPEVIIRNEKRMLQEAVDALIDNSARHTKTMTAQTGARRQLRSLADTLKGKQGRFRQNLLGKRTDYSGRSVIVVGPTLKLDECGLPKRMALELFKPFIMSEIIKRGIAHNIRSATRVIESARAEVWDILEEITKHTHVLLNRAPTLHRLGIQAFRPQLIEGKAIRIHPLVCTAFNADFDGDQMAVHVPLTEEARWEAKELMLSAKNLLKPATGAPIVTPKQDIVWGVFYLTSEHPFEGGAKLHSYATPEEAILAYRMRRCGLQDPILVKFNNLKKFHKGAPSVQQTTVGRIIFNGVFSDDFPYYNEVINFKKMGDIIKLAFERVGSDETVRILDAIKEVGFRAVTQSGYSLGMDDFPLVNAKHELVGEGERRVEEIETQYEQGLLTASERRTKIIEVWTDVKNRIVRAAKETLNVEGPVYGMMESGARGSWAQLSQVIGMKGLVSNPAGDIIELPVKSGFKEGFDVIEFFISTHGSRKGLTDTALRTANAGYLTRRLVDVAQDMVIRGDDCGDTEGFVFTAKESEEMGSKLAARVWGRHLAQDLKDAKGKIVGRTGELVDEEMTKKIETAALESARIRSLLTCRMTRGVCRTCYGLDLGTHRLVDHGVAVGIIAAQSIGEPGTQLTMRTFHTGGVAGGEDITQGLPRVEELFEARTPKRRAMVTEVSGQVTIENATERALDEGGGTRVFEARLGQRLVHVRFRAPQVKEVALEAGDEVLIPVGGAVLEGQTIISRSRGEDLVAHVPGVVKREKNRVHYEFEGESVREYVIPSGYTLLVGEGDRVHAGDPLTDGALDPHQLYALKDKEATMRYLINEVQKIYTGQGQKLNDKHIELMVRQMFSRLYITEAGDTDFLPGEVIDRAQFIEANAARSEKEKLVQGRELLLGVTKVSLSTKSFLSAASFQETARVLINAAITGKIDELEGLKENVIIGRLVPAGTGFETSKTHRALEEHLGGVRARREAAAAAEALQPRTDAPVEVARVAP